MTVQKDNYVYSTCIGNRQSYFSVNAIFLKRIFDIIFTVMIGIIVSPFVLLTIVLIKINSPGPVFFVQKRLGYRGQLFNIYKFRTMYVDAEERFYKLPPEMRQEFELYGKIKNDPRVTLIGRWLRKFSLDELPQLGNVLRGDMSLVGPRPYLVSQLSQIGNYRDNIFLIPPGVTGLWQVSGRSELPFEKRLELDAYYVSNRSIRQDLYIMLCTISVVLFQKGAY